MFNITECKTYDENTVEEAVNKLVDLSKYINEGDRVLVKPNLLDAFPIEKAVTTHPSLVKAVVKKIQEIGGSVIIADSPQLTFTKSHLNKVYKKTEMQRVADETGCELNYNTDSFLIPTKYTDFRKDLRVMSVLKDVDKVINLCKVKCHFMAKFTCATKNLYGYVTGMTKGKYHMKMNMGEYGKILLDLEEFMPPVLTIADGIIGMEGQGPFMGDPKELGLLIAGTNVYEMDYNICKIIGIDSSQVLYLKRALENKKFEENDKDFSKHHVKFKDAKIVFPFNLATKEYKAG